METWRRGIASAVALVAALLLIAFVGLVARTTTQRDDALSRERHSYDVLVAIRGLDSGMARAEAALGRFVISGDAATGAVFNDEWRRAGRQLALVKRLTVDDGSQAPLVAELARLYRVRAAELAEPASRAFARQGLTALTLFDRAGERSTVPAIAALQERITANERATLALLSLAADRSVQRSNLLLALLTALGVILTVGAAMLGWLTAQAFAAQRAARHSAQRESDRAGTLELAVEDRTRELSLANERLVAEARTREIAEAQLRQVQKMEAVGQLTGGIAHDFNNMLAVVVGGLDLARKRVAEGRDDVARHIDNAMEGAVRAATLTRRLLAFARVEQLLPEGIDPGSLVAGMSELLDRTLGERFIVETRIEDQGWELWCDRHQLENAILNLAVNARDAMPDGGTIVIAMRDVTLGDGEVGEAAAGEYVRIDVIDAGSGMSPDIVDRVFEPFFTTKPTGKGTGLGLSQIFGFARQSGGEIVIDSRLGRGTCASLYLPRRTGTATRGAAAPAQTMTGAAAMAQPAAAATILVVEDDPRVRSATVEALEELGHVPIASDSGEHALAVLAARDDIGLVISDVVMPGMTGPDLVARVRDLYPAIRTVFVTGYVGGDGDAERFRGHAVLRKPFTLAALAGTVANALGGAPPVDAAA